MTSSDSQPNQQPPIAGYVDRPAPRWMLVAAAVVYIAWLAFLLAMVWVRTTDPHYLGL